MRIYNKYTQAPCDIPDNGIIPHDHTPLAPPVTDQPVTWLDGGWHVGEVPTVAPTPEEVAAALAAAKTAKVVEAAAACDAALAPLAARFSNFESKTWPAQLEEARALLANPSLAIIPAPGTPEAENWEDPIMTLRGLTAVTGEDIGLFAEAVRKNNEDWTRVVTYAAGRRQAICASVNAISADDPDALAKVAAIDVTITLPG